MEHFGTMYKSHFFFFFYSNQKHQSRITNRQKKKNNVFFSLSSTFEMLVIINAIYLRITNTQQNLMSLHSYTWLLQIHNLFKEKSLIHLQQYKYHGIFRSFLFIIQQQQFFFLSKAILLFLLIVFERIK